MLDPGTAQLLDELPCVTYTDEVTPPASSTNLQLPPPPTPTHVDTYAAQWNSSAIVYSVDDVVFYQESALNVPNIGLGLPVPDPMVLVLQTSLAWWILPQDIVASPPQFPPGQDYTFH